MNRTPAVLSAILLAWLIVPLVALQDAGQRVRQDPGRQAPRFSTGVDLVLLDVSVLDRQRMPVHGLTAEDFTVLEDGRPQRIQTFSEVELPDAVTTTERQAPWVRNVAPDVQKNTDFKDGRVLVIAMDDATPMPAAAVALGRRMAGQAIDQLGPSDVACVVFALDKKSGQEFTRDRARLHAAVNRFNGAIPLGSYSAFDVSALTLYLASVNTVRDISEYLVDLPQRRKALLWVSVGVPIDWEAAQPALISLESPGNASTPAAIMSVVRAAGELLGAAQRANVSVYGLDPRGLEAPAPYYDALSGTTTFDVNPGRLNRDFLHGISVGTGGFAVTDTNNPLPGIRQVLRENASYYLLGYATTNPRTDGRFRKIEVKVNRDDVAVRARQGYFEPRPAKAAPAAAVAPAEAAIAGILPKSDLTMQIAPALFAIPGRANAALAIVVGIRQPAPARVTSVVQRIDLQVAAYSPGGQRRAGRRESVDVTLNFPGAASHVGYETFSKLELPPGRYQLRVAAESSLHGARANDRAPEVALVSDAADTGNRSGSVYYDLDVPDFLKARLSLSGVVISVSPAVVSGPKDRLASLIPIVPTTLREFTAGDEVTAFLRVYQGGKDPVAPVTITKRIVDARGAVVANATDTLDVSQFAKDRGADYFLDLPVGHLQSGAHLLTVEAALKDKTARRDVRFEVK